MDYLKTNIVGIDKKIQSIQNVLIDALSDWNLDSYGRVNLDEEKNPIWFVKNKDYINVLNIKDGINGQFFFVEDDKTETNNQVSTTEIDLIFLLNIEKIKPEISHRADEEVKIEILRVLRGFLTTANPIIKKGNSALEGFKTELKDYQPYHFLKFTFEINYNNF